MEFQEVKGGIFTPSPAIQKTLRGEITRFTLGGTSYEAGEMTLQMMRKCWPSIAVMVGTVLDPSAANQGDIVADQLKRARAACEIIICALGGNHLGGEVEALENSLGFNDMTDVIGVAHELLRACGFLRPLAPPTPPTPPEENQDEISKSLLRETSTNS